MNLWQLCEGEKFIKPLDIKTWRVVEAQHISSSRDLVDNIEEHDILEELLESSKPEIEKTNHYLIFTPFRYPPLDYGSRFGNKLEPSLWYGALELNTAFTEVAYYRLKFFTDTEARLGFIDIPMTAFSTQVNTQSGIDLCSHPFEEYKHYISDKSSYDISQPLGTSMRNQGVETFIYYSSRTNLQGKNIAVFTPTAFIKTKGSYIQDQQNWRCIASNNTIEFDRADITHKTRLAFSIDNLSALPF